jgi:CRP-like cAMP-binding protein
MNSSTHEEKRQILQRHFLLGKLSPNEIDTLISYARVERYATGREIFAKGSPGQCVMAVLRGSVKISSLSVGGREIVFAIFNAGDIFGEIAVLDGEERSADATAMTECELLVLNRRDFLPVLRGGFCGLTRAPEPQLASPVRRLSVADDRASFATAPGFISC